MRFVRHPGPPALERETTTPCHAHLLSLSLQAGQSVNEAVTGALGNAGFSSAYVHLENVALAPMRYVIPAPAPDASHVAWYSDTCAPENGATIEQAGVIAGVRDGQPFIHCHGIWLEQDRSRRAGHLLPHEAIMASDATVWAWGIEGAAFIVRDDAETNFRLFSAEAAEPVGAHAGRSNAVACTVRPNGDISLAIESACVRHGIREAAVFGLGSLAGIDFADGRHVPSYATEVMIREAGVSSASGAARCEIEAMLVDMDGTIHEGRLAHGRNPVCVTFEILIVAKA